MSRHPEVKWAETVDVVYITVQLPDAKDAKVNLEPDGVLTFSATAGAEKHLYELKLDLHDKVNVEESKINTGVRSIFCIVEKAEKGWWKKLLRGDEKTPHYVKVDWDRWVDEDDVTGPGGMDLGGMGPGGMDLGGMGGPGGMDFGAMGGPGGMNFGGMGGPGGMNFGGMDFSKFGGMEGMGAGMDDDLGVSDDEDQEVENIKEVENTEDVKKTGEASAGEKMEAAPSM